LGVAVTRNGRVIGEKILPPGREHLERLVPLIREVLEECRFRLTEVDGFGVAVGPGSFSGVRVGLAAIKGLALVLKKPVAGVSSLAIMARRALSVGEEGTALIDAGRAQFYAARYLRRDDELRLVAGPELAEPAYLRAPRYGTDSSCAMICDEDFAERIRGVVPAGRVRPVPAASPSICGLLAESALIDGNGDDVHALVPLYIRRSDAEEGRRCGIGDPASRGLPSPAV
jgi:tRNA threonylcarbamoyladenosine biosynthesis protein TsaB